MKRIIGLYGKAKCGKTTTLKNLIQKLAIATQRTVTINPNGDMFGVFNYKNKIICVATQGDWKGAVKQNCDFFVNQNCDIAFSATRTRGGSCNVLKALAATHTINIEWEAKAQEGNKNLQSNVNQQQADDLFNMI
jgi:hypothetical protein